jgi:arsenite methyltransferase
MQSRNKKIKDMVKEHYAEVARSCDACFSAQCCSGQPTTPLQILDWSQKAGYAKNQLGIRLGQANLGLGCGNPLGHADLQPGEVIVDLGSGTGFDAFLSAKSVGAGGKVIGVDMTQEMINKARKNAEQLDIENVEFRLGEIEHLPVEDELADVVLSNCVINLSPDKQAVYGEIFRILKRGGRLCISDVLRSKDIPKSLEDDPVAYTGWIAGAISPDEVRQILIGLGFEDISIIRKENSEEIIKSWNFKEEPERFVFSGYITARKPIATKGWGNENDKEM